MKDEAPDHFTEYQRGCVVAALENIAAELSKQTLLLAMLARSTGAEVLVRHDGEVDATIVEVTFANGGAEVMIADGATEAAKAGK